MTRVQLGLTSLVAAVPGAVLAVLMVVAFLKYAGGTPYLKVLAGALLLIGGFLALVPVGIFLFAGPKAAKAPSKGTEPEAVAKEEPSAEVEEKAAAGDSEFDFASGPASSPEVEASETVAEADFELGEEVDFVEEDEDKGKNA